MKSSIATIVFLFIVIFAAEVVRTVTALDSKTPLQDQHFEFADWTRDK